jgi:hypothetical protein
VVKGKATRRRQQGLRSMARHVQSKCTAQWHRHTRLPSLLAGTQLAPRGPGEASDLWRGIAQHDVASITSTLGCSLSCPSSPPCWTPAGHTQQHNSRTSVSNRSTVSRRSNASTSTQALLSPHLHLLSLTLLLLYWTHTLCVNTTVPLLCSMQTPYVQHTLHRLQCPPHPPPRLTRPHSP